MVRAGNSNTLARAALLQEAQLLAQFSHPNIVRVIDGVNGDMATELAFGASLLEWSKRRDWREIAPVLVAAGRGLAAVHAQGYVHYEVKPRDIRINADGHVYLVGFSSACPDPRRPGPGMLRPRICEFIECSDDPDASGQFRFGDTASSDQYSFCATAFTALHGASPFEGRCGSPRCW